MNLLAEQHAFYTERVPAQFNQTLEAQRQRVREGAGADEVARLEEMEAVRASIVLTVRTPSGDLHHAYDIDRGSMRLVEITSRPPFMQIQHTLEDFPNLRRECGDSLLGFLGGLAGLGDEMKLTALRVRSLRELAGRLLFQRVGPGGFALHASFGEAASEAVATEDPLEGSSRDESQEPAPRTTIRLDEAVYRELRSGAVDPQDAFLDGRIEIDGDMEMAIALALTAASPD